MQSGIIREFLVKLGFKMDAASERRMRESMEKMADRVKDLAKAGAVMATAVGVAVAKVANDLDGLYFSSKRIGASAGNIKAFEYAIKQMGGSGESARAALESLAKFLRDSPNGENWLQGIGVMTRDEKGNLRDTVDMYADLANVLKGMDSASASSNASYLGLDDTTLQAIRSGDMLKYMEEYRAQIKGSGLDLDAAAENAHRYEETMRRIGMKLEIVGQTIAVKVLPYVERLTDEFVKLVNASDKLGEFLDRFSKPADPSIVRRNRNQVRNSNSWLWDKIFGKSQMPEAISGKVIDESESKLGTGAAGAGSRQSGDPKSRAMAFFRGLGWTQAQAAGIVANLWHESSLDPGAIGDSGQAFGIAQWHPDRQAAFKSWSGKDIRSSSLQDQLGFVQYELTRGAEMKAGQMLLAARNAEAAGAAMSRYYERPFAADTEAAKRGATAVQLASSTTIHVTGSGDPAATAQAVATAQTGVVNDWQRQLSMVMR